jgi:4'-phosphopantetheinyl transferase
MPAVASLYYQYVPLETMPQSSRGATERAYPPSRGRRGDVRAAELTIAAHETHVWRASLDQPAAAVARFRELLADDEITRAHRFHFARDRTRYIVGRGMLRTLLGRYLERPPHDLRFAYGAFGKPRLDGEGPHFNLAHSGSLALFAFNADVELGVDVELTDDDFSRERIAERFFSKTEVRVLRSLSESLQPRAFLTCWTRKEAFIKARGDGLSLPLASFDVSLAPQAPAALLRTEWSAAEPGQWSLRDLSDASRGYVAAVAMRSNGGRVLRREVTGALAGHSTTEQGVT